MKKRLFAIFGIAGLFVALTPIASIASKPAEVKGDDATHTLTLSASENHHEYSYDVFSKKFEVLNYKGDPISLAYNRCETLVDGFAIMKPGAELHNPFISKDKNYNGFDGIKSITVTYDLSTYGDIRLSYGIDDDYSTKDILLSNGVTYTFDSLKPSHFKLTASKGESLEKYAVKVKSIVITYSSYSYYEEGEVSYNVTKIASNPGKKVIAAGETVTYPLSYNIGLQNYFIIKYRSSGCLKAKVLYTNNSSGASCYEEFFIKPDDEEFRMFLDYFRKGAAGQFGKTITGISFTNPKSEKATLYLKEVSIGDRTYSRTDEKYIQDSAIKLGISLRYGGSIIHVSNLNQGIVEYLNGSYEVKIRASSKIDDTNNKTVATNPNLVNRYDLGREIQQSYYYNVDSVNGYTRGTYSGKEISYNPVQAGDNGHYEGKIIDYFASDSKLYVKVQPCDWAHSNSLTKSYCENTYTIKDGLIYVQNQFVNWYGFTNYEENFPSGSYGEATGYFDTEELPAIYVNHPLNYYATTFDTYDIFDPNQGWNTGTTAIEKTDSASFVANGDGTYRSNLTKRSYHYSFRKHTGDYMGYFNQDKFGLAVYMPAQKYNHDSIDRHVYVSGNLYESHATSYVGNREYYDDDFNLKQPTNYNFKKYPVESSRISNVNYMASILGFFPSEYTTLKWGYAIGADYLDTLKGKFTSLASSNAIYNDFTIWKGALI